MSKRYNIVITDNKTGEVKNYEDELMLIIGENQSGCLGSGTPAEIQGLALSVFSIVGNMLNAFYEEYTKQAGNDGNKNS